jgi:hypothetical protein
MTTETKWSLPIKKTATYIKEYFGIADAYGLESFEEKDDDNKEQKGTIARMQIRVESDRHRHAVFYLVRLEDVDAEWVNGFIADGKPSEALSWVKTHAINGEVMLAAGGNVKGSWKMIPNPKLDPWGSHDEEDEDE